MNIESIHLLWFLSWLACVFWVKLLVLAVWDEMWFVRSFWTSTTDISLQTINSNIFPYVFQHCPLSLVLLEITV